MPRAPILSLLLLACGGDPDGSGAGIGGGEDTQSEGSICQALQLSAVSIDLTGLHRGASASETLVMSSGCSEGSLPLAFSWENDDDGGLGMSLPEPTTLEAGERLELPFTWTADDYTQVETVLLIDAPAGLVEISVRAGAETDQDGDGHVAIEAGGGDCDDRDSLVFPQDSELAWDLIDDDCDGTADEDFVVAGDIVITELFTSPSTAEDALGEWLELQSRVDTSLVLTGWRLVGSEGEEVVIEGPVLLEPGERVVLAGSVEESLNGGVPADHAWAEGTFTLDRTEDTVQLVVGELVMTQVSWDATWLLQTGASHALDPSLQGSEEAATADAWCLSDQTFGDGEAGSPGAENSWCAHLDHDGDGQSVEEGDCDDTASDRHEGNKELWDEVDNDCDGLVDTLTEDNVATWLQSASDAILGHDRGLSAGDLDGDGLPELIASSITFEAHADGTTRHGGMHALPLAAWAASPGDDAGDWASSSFWASEASNRLGLTGPFQGDLDSDGFDDLVLGGTTFNASADEMVSGAVLLGPLSGTLSTDDAWATWTGSDTAITSHALLSHLDFDGDGLADVVYSDYGESEQRGEVSLMSGELLAQGGAFTLDDAEATLEGATSGYLAGHSLGGGDLDGDGHPELVVGAPGASINVDDGGAVFILDGSTVLDTSGELTDVYRARIRGSADDEKLGAHAVPQVVDLTGDGLADLAVSAPGAEAVFLFKEAGELDGAYQSSDSDVRIQNLSSAAWFGWELASGDLDGDGGLDLVIAAPDGTGTGSSSRGDDPGEVFVFAGSSFSTGSASSNDAAVHLPGVNLWHLGAALTVDDFDGDGVDELGVAESLYGSDAGRVLLSDLN